jgi:uncharacterized membrane protein YqjE
VAAGRGLAGGPQTPRGVQRLTSGSMHFVEPSLAAISKHQIAGIVCAVAAVVLVIWGGARMAARAAGVAALLLLAALAAVLAILFFTRAV